MVEWMRKGMMEGTAGRYLEGLPAHGPAYLLLRWSWQERTSSELGWPPSTSSWTVWFTPRTRPIRLFISWSRLSNLQRKDEHSQRGLDTGDLPTSWLL